MSEIKTLNGYERIAIVDIGSNTVRLVVFDALAELPIPIFNESVVCAMGKGLGQTGVLNPNGIDLAMRALKRFIKLVRELQVQNFVMLATAAVRDASDGEAFVEKVKNGYQMFYTSNTKWKKINGRLVPKYFIKLATSNNAIDWKFKSNIMKFKSKNEIAISRPWVISCKKKKYLFYSYRGKNYQIGCAEVKRNNFLKRIDNNTRIKNNIDNFDNTMNEYASVIEYKNKLIMFYNGNNFGAEGIGIAEIEKDKIS